MIDENLDELEDIEELEELEELEDLDGSLEAVASGTKGPAPSERPETKIVASDIYYKLKSLYSRSDVPVLITDSRFTIIYGNPSLIRNIILEQSIVSKSFFNIIDSGSLHSNPSEIIQSLRSPDTGFSWIGSVGFKHTNFLNVSTNAVFTPVYENGSELTEFPIGYICIFDDITKKTKDILAGTYLSLLEASKLKDNDTGNHIRRVGEYSRIIAKHLYKSHKYPEVNVQFIENIAFLAPMHDVGKIGTPDDILHKTGPLDKKEWSIMKEHTINGGFIMGGYPDEMARQIPLSHHERWDGTGYPYQLAEEMIPLAARITMLADVYDALRMKRSYKEPFNHEKACDIITKDAGTHFDPALVEVFLELNAKIQDVFDLLSDSGQSGHIH